MRFVFAGIALCSLLANTTAIRICASDTASSADARAPKTFDPPALQQSRFAAMVAGDIEALRELLADELHYVHSDGRVETKALFLHALESKLVRYESITPRDLQSRVVGDVAIIAGTVSMQIRAQERSISFHARFTEIYERRGGRWQLTLWQTTRIPETAAK